MKTPEEIKNALHVCTTSGCNNDYCAYTDDGDCSGSVMKDSLALIEQLEKKVADAEAAIEERDAVISLMQIQMQGDCGCCKHKDDRGLCAQCMSIAYHPDWEYEGLPEIPKGYVPPKKGES